MHLTEKTQNCKYRYFYHNSGVDDFSVKYDDWRALNSEGIELESDFVDVSCRGTFGVERYRYQHGTVIPKKISIESNRLVIFTNLPNFVLFTIMIMFCKQGISERSKMSRRSILVLSCWDLMECRNLITSVNYLSQRSRWKKWDLF